MIFIEESGSYIIAKCEKCGANNKKHKCYCKQYGDDYHFNPPITCNCGNTERVVCKKMEFSHKSNPNNENNEQKVDSDENYTDFLKEEEKYFEETYKNNFNLEHTKVEDIFYFDEDEDKYFKADLELFGKSFRLITYDKGKPMKEIRGNCEALDYKIIKVHNNMIEMEFWNHIVKVNYNSYLIMKEYNDKYNSTYIDGMRDIAEQINAEVCSLLNNDDMDFFSMINNFISNVPIEIFLNPKLIIQVETYLSFHYRNCGELYLLLSDELRRATLSTVKENIAEYSGTLNFVTYELIFEDNDVVYSYIDEFNLLREFMQNEFGIDESVSAYFVYVALYKVAKAIFPIIWQEEYSDYFPNISEMTLEEAVLKYFEIDIINQDNIQTIGEFVYYLMDNDKFIDNINYLSCYDKFMDMYKDVQNLQKIKSFKRRVLNTQNFSSNKNVTINDIDLMNGAEFEHFIAQLFQNLGYKTEITKHSGDQGIDIIAENNGVKIGIQAKCYSSSVSNSAIQEVVAGKNHYRLDKALVITNSTFTKSAIELANSNGVILWDRNILKEKL